MMHTLRKRSCKAERKRGQRYSNKFRRHAVERMNMRSNIVELARELGVGRMMFYNWRD